MCKFAVPYLCVFCFADIELLLVQLIQDFSQNYSVQYQAALATVSPEASQKLNTCLTITVPTSP